MIYHKVLLLCISGLCMVGQGSRMIFEGVMTDRVYRPNTFDLFFDWSTLTLAGAIVLIWSIYLFYKVRKAREHVVWKLKCPTCGQLFDEDLGKQGTECPYCHTAGEISLDGFDMDAAVKKSIPTI